jgi:hypothetical protein
MVKDREKPTVSITGLWVVQDVEEDLTLLGHRVEQFINAVVPTFIVRWFHDHECGCIKRREYLNDKHYQFRQWRLKRAENNYTKAREKLDKLKARL